jgi:peptide/nickel transport system permease protein
MTDPVTRAVRQQEMASAGELASVGSPIRLGAQTFIKNRAALAGLIIIVLMLGFSFLGPLFYHTNQVNTDLPAEFLPPGAGHPLGTDENGYDELGRLMLGGQSALEVGLAAALVATVVGIVYGAVSGFVGGIVDGFMMRIVDALLAIPTLFLTIYLFTVYTPSLAMMIVVIGVLGWLVTARLVRAETLSLRTREFVQAVRSAGGTRRRMIVRHIIPNTAGTIMVNATFQVADSILALASLSYLGLGIAPPAANWGGMLSDGVQYTFAGRWWLYLPAGLCILLTVMAFNAVGDGLRDASDVRLQRR